MLLVELVALILVIVGIVIITRGQLWVGVVLIVLAVMLFLLRNQLVSGSDTAANLGRIRLE